MRHETRLVWSSAFQPNETFLLIIWLRQTTLAVPVWLLPVLSVIKSEMTLRPRGWCSRVNANMISRAAGHPAWSWRDLCWTMRWDVTRYPHSTRGVKGVPTMPCVASTSKINTTSCLVTVVRYDSRGMEKSLSRVWDQSRFNTQRDNDGHDVNSSFLENLELARISSVRFNKRRSANFRPCFILR